jgi:hypothetical protein
LRKKLADDEHKKHLSHKRYDRLVAQLVRAEAMAYGDLGRLLDDLDQRVKAKARKGKP